MSLINTGIVATIVSCIVTTVLVYNSKATNTSYIYEIFGVKSTDIIAHCLLFTIIAGSIGLLGFSYMVNDVKFPYMNPGYFMFEISWFSIIPSLVIFLMILFRGYTIKKMDILDFLMLVLQFASLHILLQLSGFFSSIYPPLSVRA